MGHLFAAHLNFFDKILAILKNVRSALRLAILEIVRASLYIF